MKRVLVKYSKQGDAVYLSHRETMRSLERALRRSGLPLSFTAGFSPRPRLSFSPALPLGVAAEAEYLEVAVEEEVDAEEARRRLNQALPAGLEVREVTPLPENMPKLSRWALYGLYRRVDEENGPFLVLSLGGSRQGRLRDALLALEEAEKESAGSGALMRVGLYASLDEVMEEAEGPLYYYDGEKGELEKVGEG